MKTALRLLTRWFRKSDKRPISFILHGDAEMARIMGFRAGLKAASECARHVGDDGCVVTSICCDPPENARIPLADAILLLPDNSENV